MSADEGQENMKAIMAGMDEFIVDDPTVPGVAQFDEEYLSERRRCDLELL